MTQMEEEDILVVVWDPLCDILGDVSVDLGDWLPLLAGFAFMKRIVSVHTILPHVGLAPVTVRAVLLLPYYYVFDYLLWAHVKVSI